MGSAGIRLRRRGWRLGGGSSALRQSSGFAGICGAVTVRMTAPGSSRGVASGDADWPDLRNGVVNCLFARLVSQDAPGPSDYVSHPNG